MLRVNPPFKESVKIKPIQINDVFKNLTGKNVLISGWGHTTDEFWPDKLQKTLVIVRSYDYGNDYGKCVLMRSSEGNNGACNGDSGGNFYLIYIFR